MGSQEVAQRVGAGAGGSGDTETVLERSAAAASGAVCAGGTENAPSGPSSRAAFRSGTGRGGSQPASAGSVVSKIPPTNGSTETAAPARPVRVALAGVPLASTSSSRAAVCETGAPPATKSRCQKKEECTASNGTANCTIYGRIFGTISY